MHDVDDLWAEVSYVAYHVHWDLDRILGLEHHDRRRMVDAIADLNEQAFADLGER